MDLLVTESTIQGRGVFAARHFKKGEVVLDWSNSPTITPKQVKNLPRENKKFVYYQGDQCILVTVPARYVNHSCNPNTFIQGFFGIAKRDIKQGEEITEDYALENPPNAPIPCLCGSKNCKGTK